ncbi:MAG: hypothetical protein ACXWL8_06150 [Candidatus Limnocylindria bacterium]
MVAVIAPLLVPGPAAAHAFGEAFPLPIPLWMMLGGAGLAVAASFIVAGVVVRTGGDLPRYPHLRIPALPARAMGVLLALAGLVWWYGAIVAAFVLGSATPLPTILFWIFIWAGLPIFTVVLGNPWPSLSPFRTTFALLEWLARFFGFDRLDLGLPYPIRLARWPAVYLLFAGVWSELVLPGAVEPNVVGLLMVGYTLVTLVGIACFGRVAWLRNAELFEVLLGWFGRIGPIGRRAVEPNACAGCGERCDPDRCVDCSECAAAADARERRSELRPWIAGLTEVRRAGWSDAAFILLALAGVTYDGLRETNAWAEASNWAFPFVFPALDAYKAILVVGTAGLLAVWLAFIVAFLVSAGITHLLSERAAARGGLGTLVGAYAATLLPIAGGYMIAHYLTLVVQGIVWVPELVRNPGAVTEPPLDMIPTAFVWYLSVGAIVIGHIAAIFLAHRIALRDAPARPVRAGVPLAVLMVAYTVLSLSIIAAPIATEPGTPATVSELTSD